MNTYELTKEGLERARRYREMGVMTGDKPLPIRVQRESLKEALLYYWGRGIGLDPNDLKWSLTKESAN